MLRISSSSLSQIEAERLRASIDDAIATARKVLPEIPDDVTITFDLGSESSGVGLSANLRAAGVVALTWDASFPDKTTQLIALRSELLHHAYHWCQGYTYESPTAVPRTGLESALYEEVASVFAREYSATDPLWSNYEPLPVSTLQTWHDELDALPVAAYAAVPELWRTWAGPSDDPDDSWRIHRVGTWIVDRFMKQTGKSILDLRHMSAKEILDVAE